MTNPDYTHLTLVLDRSGSMATTADDANGGIRTLLAEQFAADGKLTVTAVQFDNEFETLGRMVDKNFDAIIVPRGMTALRDAVGMEIVATGHDLANLPEDQRPGRVLFIVVTDGMENSSHEYSPEQVKNMIEEQRNKYGWDFQFIGAGEAALQAAEYGMAAASYDAAAKDGSSRMYGAVSANMAQYRAAPAAAASFEMPEEV